MATSGVSPTTTIATQAVRQQPEPAEVREQENRRSAQVRTENVQKVEEPKAAVNTTGQTIGTKINTTA
ncbi:MAG: hypothetical protein H7315_20330 [Herminiimonas sp.]|nr:hypothetical protein [Herminiimonas sp.]